jgi:hypothetical protein
MTWLKNNREFKEEDIPEDAWGFTYLITNLTNNRKYIGKKLLTKAAPKKKVILKDGTVGKKKKVQPRKVSNWKDYWSSCDELKDDVAKLGKENFKREILEFYNCDARLSAEEAREQFVRRVLDSDEYYNGMIKITCYKKNIKDKK